MQQGFHPDVINTDLHIGSQNSGMKAIVNTMSKFLNLGMPLADVIKANTARAAGIIKHTELGHLGAGSKRTSRCWPFGAARSVSSMCRAGK